MPRLLVLLVALCVLVFAAGCGGDDSDDGGAGAATTATTATGTTTGAGGASAQVAEYRRQVTQISRDFAQAGATFRSSVSAGSTPQQAADELEEFQDRVRQAAEQLQAVSPPANVAAPHRRLTEAFRGIARACGPAIEAGKEGDRPHFRSALRVLQRELNTTLGDQAKQAAQQIDQGLAGQ